jgi:uncharacterized RDD family membrane protein YckC
MAEEQATSQQEGAGTPQGGGPERVGFGPRLGAWLIDNVIASIVGGIIGSVAGASLLGLFMPSMVPDTSEVDTSGMSKENAEAAQEMAEGIAAAGGGIIGAIGGLLGGAFLFLFIIMLIEAFAGTTPGKMMLGLKNADQDGTAGGVGVFVGRAAIKYIHMLFYIISGILGVSILTTVGSILGLVVFIGCFFVLGQNRQAFHDMIAKTAVFRKNEIR